MVLVILVVFDSVLVGFDNVFDIVFVVHGSSCFGCIGVFDSVGHLLVFWLSSIA